MENWKQIIEWDKSTTKRFFTYWYIIYYMQLNFFIRLSSLAATMAQHQTNIGSYISFVGM